MKQCRDYIHQDKTSEWCKAYPDSRISSKAKKIAAACKEASSKPDKEGWHNNINGGDNGTRRDSRIKHAHEELRKAVNKEDKSRDNKVNELMRLGWGLHALQDIAINGKATGFEWENFAWSLREVKELTMIYIKSYCDGCVISTEELAKEALNILYVNNIEFLEQVIQYAKLCNFVYINDHEKIENLIKTIALPLDEKEDKEIQLLDDSNDHGNFNKYFHLIVIKEPDKKRVIIAFRGTETKRDIWVTDLRLWFFNNFPDRIDRRCSPLIEEIISSHKNHEIIFIGHSLGGALAKLYAFRYHKKVIAFDPIAFKFLPDFLLDRFSSFDNQDFSLVTNFVTDTDSAQTLPEWLTNWIKSSKYVHMGIEYEEQVGSNNYIISIKKHSMEAIYNYLLDLKKHFDTVKENASLLSHGGLFAQVGVLQNLEKLNDELEEKMQEVRSSTSMLFTV